MKKLQFLTLLLAMTLVIWSCKDDDPNPVIVSSIDAVGTSFTDGSAVTKSLNGSSSAEDVPLNATITATFDKDIDGTTVDAANVKITGPNGDIPSSVSNTTNSVTIDPTDDLDRGTLYTLSIGGLEAADGGEFTMITRTFTTEGRAPVVVPNAANQLAYWSFDESTSDVTGNFVTSKEVGITYGMDRFGQGNSVATFDGDVSIIEIADADQLMSGPDFTLSFWVKTNNEDHVNADGNPASHFVMGLAAFKGFQFEIPADHTSCKLATQYVLPDGSTTAEDTWFPGDGKDKDNGGWQGWDFVADLTGSGGVEGLILEKWAHIICTYNATDKVGRMYINGDLMKSFDFDLWDAGTPKSTIEGVGYGGLAPSELPELAFGFIHSSGGTLWDDTPWGDYDKPTANHFKGQLDDVRVFDYPYSENDAKDLYNAEKN